MSFPADFFSKDRLVREWSSELDLDVRTAGDGNTRGHRGC